MKCQTCGTRDPTKFATSVLICVRCLVNKQLSAYTLAQIKKANDYMKQKISEVLIYGVNLDKPEPKGILNAHNIEPMTLEKVMTLASQDKIFVPPDAWNCKCIAPDYDSIEMTRQIRASQLRDFARAMQRPIHIDRGYVQFLADEYFDNTTPLLDNVILPTPL